MKQSRSRVIWDAARRPEATARDKLRPFLYELGIPALITALSHINFDSVKVGAACRRKARTAGKSVAALIPFLALPFRSKRSSLTTLSVLVYLIVLVTLHLKYGIGSFLFITSLLILMYKYGFDDAMSNNGMSAFSVFNKGFTNMLGALDGQNLMDQYVAGQAGFGAAVAAQGPRDGDVADDVLEDVEEDIAEELAVRRRGNKKKRRNNNKE